MLCRVLLTIIAVSCTFSRELIVNAHDQGTQRLVQIKDIICVLLLSGLQKDDLDVNMLKKLQRHNVNLDDMNNENLRQECVSRSTFGKIDRKIETTTEEIKEEITQNKKNQGSTEAQLQTIMQYLIDSKSDDRTEVARIEVTTNKFDNSDSNTTLQMSGIKFNLDEAGKYEKLNTKKSYTEIESMSGMGNPDFQKFIKLWNMFNKEYTKDYIKKETSKPTFKQVEKHTLQPNAIKPSASEKQFEMDYNISKIIKDYISKNKIDTTTSSPTSTKNVIIDTISHQIKQYLAAHKDIKQINGNNKIKSVPFILLNLLLNDTNMEPNVKIIHKNTDEINNSFKLSLKNKAKKLINQILLTDEQSNEPVVHYGKSVTERPYLSQNELKLKVIESYESHKNDNIIDKMNGSVKQIINENNNIKDFKIPVDILKEIAESVKAIVIKDLKNDLSTVKSRVILTERTTEREPTRLQQERLQNSDNTMEKFMKLFQEFNIMKEKLHIPDDAKLKTTEKKITQNDYIGHLKLGYPPLIPPINPYGVIMPVAEMTPVFTSPYNQNSNLHTPYVHDSNKNNNVKSIHKITQVNIFHPKNEPQPVVPLTIQTNSYEIPPLGIPVSKPINMVNQNIVVTTKNPYMRPKIDRHHGNILHQEFDYNNKRNPNDWFNTYATSNRHRTYDDLNVDRIKGSNRNNQLTDKTRERQKHTNDNNDNAKYRSGYYKPHFNKSDYSRMRLRNKDIKKFHERLERTDDSNIMDERDECCRMKVASRQQIPLTNVMNRSRYDDTHFKNFLKTQQKVNAMLERILATKTKSDGPRSVEIP